MNQWPSTVVSMFAQAKAELANDQLTTEKLDEMLQTVLAHPGKVRQRLLYLHAALPSIRAPIIGSALHEPVAGSVTQIDPLAPELPYDTVFDAVLDGWRVIHFPDQRAPFEDREIDMVGYEFILEKMEIYDD